MLTSKKITSISSRFKRSARLDSDIGKADALSGYILQPSVAKAFETMARSLSATGQGAFTWTGPYGGGKSSAALAFAAMLGADGAAKDVATKVFGSDLNILISAAFRGSKKGRRLVALTGRRADLQDDLSQAFDCKRSDLIGTIELAMSDTKRDGLFLVVDEIGKYLEHASIEGGDIHILQDLAELASRSNGRFVLLGILHQSFEQYANRLAKSARNEWAKIQGRFQDIPMVSVADETLELLAKAINGTPPKKEFIQLANEISQVVRGQRSGVSDRLTQSLVECMPLHPVVSLLIGPIARHRFGQNERSVFGFLTSGEPLGFAEFINSAEAAQGQLYTPDMLFDYLSANLGPAILSSPEGHRFSTSLYAIDRASAKGGRTHERLAKTMALIEQFGAGSGVVGTREALSACLFDIPEAQVAKAIEDLTSWAVLVYRRHKGTYAIHSGSDFDLDKALELCRGAGGSFNIAQRLAMSSVIAKRHYFETGSLRWWDVAVYLVPELDFPKKGGEKHKILEAHRRVFTEWLETIQHEALLVLIVQPSGISGSNIDTLAAVLAERDQHKSLVVGVPRDTYLLRESANELQSLETVQRDNPQLEGDSIARREVSARISEVVTTLEQEVRRGFAGAKWFAAGGRKEAYDYRPLSEIASCEADIMYPDTPIIRSELLNRQKLSSNAAAALRNLLHAMVKFSDVGRLNIDGFPPEYALYATLLEDTGIHRVGDIGAYGFFPPLGEGKGASYAPVWIVADQVRQGTSIAELYNLWSDAPYGMKRGSMPVLALAWLLANVSNVAIYDDGLFCPTISDLLVDRLLQSPDSITIRRVENNIEDDVFLSALGQMISLDSSTQVHPLDVARGLVQIFASFPKWTQRTRSATALTRKIRDLILKANDPHQLLFLDLSSSSLGTEARAEAVQAAISELTPAYSNMLDGLRRSLAAALGTSVNSFEGLQRRSASVQGITGELRLNAFALRVATLEDEPSSLEAMEGLGSFLTHKPTRNWMDQDVDRAHAELLRLCQQFREAEAMAQIRGRATGAESISLVIASRGTEPKLVSFQVNGKEAEEAKSVADDIMGSLALQSATVSLAALAEVIRRLEDTQNIPEYEVQ